MLTITLGLLAISGHLSRYQSQMKIVLVISPVHVIRRQLYKLKKKKEEEENGVRN